MPLQPEQARPTVSIEGSEPIRGWVDDGTGSGRRFTGWLGLISAVQEALGDRGGGDGREPVDTKSVWR